MDTSRRQVIRSLAGGSILFPGLLTWLLAEDRARAGEVDPLAPRSPHFPGKAKRVILLHMTGGVSHMDTFDPKPRLTADDGKTLRGPTGKPFLASPWKFQPARRVRHRGQRAVPARRRLHGRHLPDPLDEDRPQRPHPGHPGHPHRLGHGRPAEPRLVGQLRPGDREPRTCPPSSCWPRRSRTPGPRSGAPTSCPAATRGPASWPGPSRSPTSTAGSPPPGSRRSNWRSSTGSTSGHQRDRVGRPRAGRPDPLLRDRLRDAAEPCPRSSTWRRRPTRRSSSTAWSAGSTKGFAWQCLIARRLAERGVRFVELIDIGSSNNWDAHGNMQVARAAGQERRQADRRPAQGPQVARACSTRRWSSGRPSSAGPRSTDSPRRPEPPEHRVFLLAGRRRRQGRDRPRQDRRLRRAKVVEDEVHVHDFHATILHLLGFDHTRLTYRHAGRDFRLTDVSGNVVESILA